MQERAVDKMKEEKRMEKIFKKDYCPIAGLAINKNYNKYSLSIKVGTYYTFDYTQIANQVHYHDSYELVIVLKGKGSFIYKNQNHLLSKGDIFLSEPFVNHEIHINPRDTLTLLYIFINFEEKSMSSSQMFEEKIIDSFIHQHHNILHNQYQLNAYLSFFNEYKQDQKFRNDIWLYKTLETFLLNCLDILAINESKDIDMKYDANIFERTLDYIDQNLSKKISADIISKEMCTSRRNLYYLFEKNLNKSVHNYINERKISLAEHYLMMNLNVTEAASLVGIDNLSYFNKLFRKYKNISPREYVRKVIPNMEGYGRRLMKE